MVSDLTRLHVYERRGHLPHHTKGFRTAVSLHCHTNHSRELLTFIPHYAKRIPILSRFYRREMDRYPVVYGKTIDFSRAWWTPPLTARQVFEMETLEVESRLGLPAIVSITDHDEIAAGLWLQAFDSQGRIPVSVEWTAPYGKGFFHLGVHNLPPDRASEVMREMSAYTQQAEPRMELRDLLAWINEFPETLVVLNHPLWDIEFIGAQQHAVALGVFLGEHKTLIHALEVNGFRSWRENKAVMAMAKDFGLPVVSGGDRHGCRSNTVLNLTRAASFAEFVAEVREDGRSDVLLMPEYRESRVLRTLEVVADVLRHYPNHPQG
ncbi:MAG: PHP domain-containing protein, partial [Blastocatellia bacterium]